MASDGRDLKLEEAFCLFLLGQVYFSTSPIKYPCLFSFPEEQVALQGSEAEALERLHQLESNKKSASRNPIFGKEGKNAPATDYSLVCLHLSFFCCSPPFSLLC